MKHTVRINTRHDSFQTEFFVFKKKSMLARAKEALRAELESLKQAVRIYLDEEQVREPEAKTATKNEWELV